MALIDTERLGLIGLQAHSSSDQERAEPRHKSQSPSRFHSNTASPTHFPLLTFPVELQTLILHHALGGHYSITLDYERITMLRSHYHVRGLPPLALSLVSHHIHDLVSPLRLSLFTGRLILNSVFILVPLRRQDRFEWLREYTRILHFSDSSVHPERWGRYYDVFRGLKRIEIEMPIVKRVGGVVEEGKEGTETDGMETRVPKVEDVLEGKEDSTLLKSMDRFMMALLGTGGWVVMVTVRFALQEGLGSWGGFVICDIRLDHGKIQIVKRRFAAAEDRIGERRAELVYANGNVIDAGSHRSIWEWYKAFEG